MRLSRAMRTAAWVTVAVGAAAPMLRRRTRVPPVLTQAVAFAAPVGLCVAVRRSRARDAAVCALQMWAYLAAYKAPHDDPEEQARRVRLDYPIVLDELLGLGTLPTVRLQRALARSDSWRWLDRVLVWAHWSWFAVPHGSLLYILWRRRERFGRAAVLTYAVFDLGACVYWVLPTAPPWYAATVGQRVAGVADRGAALAALAAGEADPGRHRPSAGEQPAVRRMMVEYGEYFWKDGWAPLYDVLGGNPLAAMPSLHFATSLMAALLLAETGPLAGAAGSAYAATLGFALVYLGEHYVVDLLAGGALTLGLRRLEPLLGPPIEAAGRSIAALEALAHRER